MELVFALAREVRPLPLHYGGKIKVGRSFRADFQLTDTGASNAHLEVSVGRNPGELTILDVSQNGTGVILPGGGPDDVIPLTKGEPTSVPIGSGFLAPLRKVGGETKRDVGEVLWVRTARQPEPGVGPEPAGAALPTKETRERPRTWPKSWASLPQTVQDVWMREGIEDAQDLKSFYTSTDELRGELQAQGATEEEIKVADAYWRDSGRASALAKPSREPVPVARAESPPRVEVAPSAKRKRGPPRCLHAPGVWQDQWLAKQRAKEAGKEARAAQSQGLAPASSEHLDEIWMIFTRAGGASSLYRPVEGDEARMLKDLVLRPIRRYADSLAGRLAAWRRWEAWVGTQRPGEQRAPFRPTDILLGKYLTEVDRGGPTAASQAWAALKWWSERLGLGLPLQSPLVKDFSMKHQGHTTRQAEVLPLDIIARLREEAEGAGTRGTFASILLLIAGGCVRFQHAQRSEIKMVTGELVVCWCAKGKRRQQGVREGYRWATPRCWRPSGDTLAKAVRLIREVATKAKGYADRPFLVPDLSTGQGHVIDPTDSWLPRPMSYPKFVALLRRFVADMGGKGGASDVTFNSLRRLMPTGADVLQFSDSAATAIGNWQDTPKSGTGKGRSRMKESMAKRYAGDKVITAGHYKMRVVAAIYHSEPEEGKKGHQWTHIRDLHLDKKALQEMARKFKVEHEVAEGGGDPGCLPELPCGPLRHREQAPLRVIPDLSEIAWFMQSRARGVYRPWVHFAAGTGDKPYCRRTRFRRDPILQGKGVDGAARTGERPCPRCLRLLGDKAPVVLSEFCVGESGPSGTR